jgi:hypothetical protein
MGLPVTKLIFDVSPPDLFERLINLCRRFHARFKISGKLRNTNTSFELAGSFHPFHLVRDPRNRGGLSGIFGFCFGIARKKAQIIDFFIWVGWIAND